MNLDLVNPDIFHSFFESSTLCNEDANQLNLVSKQVNKNISLLRDECNYWHVIIAKLLKVNVVFPKQTIEEWKKLYFIFLISESLEIYKRVLKAIDCNNVIAFGYYLEEFILGDTTLNAHSAYIYAKIFETNNLEMMKLYVASGLKLYHFEVTSSCNAAKLYEWITYFSSQSDFPLITFNQRDCYMEKNKIVQDFFQIFFAQSRETIASLLSNHKLFLFVARFLSFSSQFQFLFSPKMTPEMKQNLTSATISHSILHWSRFSYPARIIQFLTMSKYKNLLLVYGEYKKRDWRIEALNILARWDYRNEITDALWEIGNKLFTKIIKTNVFEKMDRVYIIKDHVGALFVKWGSLNMLKNKTFSQILETYIASCSKEQLNTVIFGVVASDAILPALKAFLQIYCRLLNLKQLNVPLGKASPNTQKVVQGFRYASF